MPSTIESARHFDLAHELILTSPVNRIRTSTAPLALALDLTDLDRALDTIFLDCTIDIALDASIVNSPSNYIR
jgi:hypothetical protein